MPGEVSNLLGEVADQPQQRLHVDVVAEMFPINSLWVGGGAVMQLRADC